MVNYEKSNLIENYTTPEIQFRLLKKIYDNKNEYLDFLELLKNSAPPHNGLKKYIPHKIISHKLGVFKEAANDIGIVFTKNPYIIIFYSKNLSNAFEKIAQLSEIIYKEHI
jgi:beta-lactamase class A